MRILHLDSGREMRGGQWQALRLHRALLERGIESRLLVPAASPLLQQCDSCEELRPLRLGLMSRGFDLVHAHDARSHTLGALFSRVPFVVSRRVAFPVKATRMSRWKYSRPARYLAVSKYVAGVLVDAGVPPEKITVVYDGVPVPERAARGHAVLTPYSHDPEKGMQLAMDAAMLAEVPLLASEHLEADLPEAQALVYLTKSEGLGSGVLLAMAHGVSVIASNIGGIPELIQDGRTGILVENNLEAVASAFRRIDPALGAAAREHVRNRFTVDHMVDATIALYRQVLA